MQEEALSICNGGKYIPAYWVALWCKDNLQAFANLTGICLSKPFISFNLTAIHRFSVCLFVCLFVLYTNLHHCKECLKMLCALWWDLGPFSYGTGVWLTTYAVDKNRPPVFFYSGVRDTILIPRVAWLPQRSSLILVVSEHSRPLRKTQNVFYGNDLWQSALWQKTVRYFLDGGPTYVYNVHPSD